MNNVTITYTAYILPTLLVILFPFFGFLINGLLGKRVPNPLSGWIATLALVGSFGCSLYLFNSLPADASFNIDLFD